jgi:ABC-type transport system involved in cytochrome c biogenesis permease subunit
MFYLHNYAAIVITLMVSINSRMDVSNFTHHVPLRQSAAGIELGKG